MPVATRRLVGRRQPRQEQHATLKHILEPIDADLKRVTHRVVARLQDSVARKAIYLITAGGKQLRPALVLLAGRSGDALRCQGALLDLAVATELIHTATLIHDDIIDHAALRRRQPTFHERFGTERAVLMGDYLYSVAFTLLSDLEDSYVTQVMSGVCQRLSRGEFFEVDRRFDIGLTEGEYLEIIRDKTASLLAACCQLGAHVAGARPEIVERLREFGLNFGMAFQIMDDCLDLIGEEQVVGKTLRSDLDKGSLSLPVIYLATSLSKSAREALFAPWRQGAPDRRFLSRIATAVQESGAIAKAFATAERFLQQAAQTIVVRDGIGLASTYDQLTRYAIQRVR